MSGPQPSSVPTGQRLAERYGTVRRPWARRVAVAGVSLLVALALGWWLWVAVGRSTPDIRWELLGYDVQSDASIELRWTVDRPVGATLDCVVRAQDLSGLEVGRAQVRVPPADLETTELTRTVVTTGRAIVGEVLSCLSVDG